MSELRTFSLTWLPQVLEEAGLKVAEAPGWRTRGRAEMGVVRGVMCHHTGTPDSAPGNMPTYKLLIDGRHPKPPAKPLPGPLAQLGLGRDGAFYVIAAGRANHAGEGRWEGVTTGNSSFIGIEAEHSGTGPWPDVQMDAYARGVAAILKKIGARENMCCGHKEYALPKGRKPDPNFDMALFRVRVGDLLNGKTPNPLIPAREPDGGGGASRATLRRGDRGPLVRVLQAALGVNVDGDFGPATEARARAFQRAQGLVADGIVGPRTWVALDAAAAAPAG